MKPSHWQPAAVVRFPRPPYRRIVVEEHGNGWFVHVVFGDGSEDRGFSRSAVYSEPWQVERVASGLSHQVGLPIEVGAVERAMRRFRREFNSRGTAA